MKNTFKTIGILAFITLITFSFITCKGDAGNPGRLSLSGLNSYNGKYAIAAGRNTDDTISLFAGDGIEEAVVKGREIKNGAVELEVWQVKDGKLADYSGNDGASFAVIILKGTTFSFLSLFENPSDIDIENFFLNEYVTIVSFKNGAATGLVIPIPEDFLPSLQYK